MQSKERRLKKYEAEARVVTTGAGDPLLDCYSPFGPVTLKMRACLGCTEQQLQAECDYVTRCAARDGGRSGQFFSIFPPPGGRF